MKPTVERLYTEAVETAMSSLENVTTQLNGSTNREYQKTNKLLLTASQAMNNFKSNEWLSQEQIKEAGLSIKKDSKGTMLFSYQIKDTDKTKLDEESGTEKPVKAKFYRYYYVFNRDQLEKAQ